MSGGIRSRWCLGAVAAGFDFIGGWSIRRLRCCWNADEAAPAASGADGATAEADGYKVEKAVFRFSLIYLFLHFVVFRVEAVLRASGMGGW